MTDEQKVDDALEKAKIRLSKAQIRLGFDHEGLVQLVSLLERLERVYLPERQDFVLATNGKQLLIALENIKPRSDDDLEFILLHELIHMALGHNFRMREVVESPAYEKDRENAALYANIAMDNVVNEFILGLNIFRSPPRDTVYNPRFKGMAWEQIFHKIYVKNPPNNPPPKDGGFGQDVQPAEGDSQADVEEQEMLNDAAMESVLMSIGDTPLGERIRTGRGRKSEIPWQQKLESKLIKILPVDYSRARPNKTMMRLYNVLLPGAVKAGSGSLAVILDTSGSMTSDYKNTAAEICNIAQKVRPMRMDIIHVDWEVQKHEIVQGRVPSGEMELFGGGGTRLAAGFDYLKDKHINPDYIIVLSDMEDSMEMKNPGVPTIWVQYREGYYAAKPTFGEVVKVKGETP